MGTNYVQDEQGSRGHEAEHRHEHHPALDQGDGHQGGSDQDPHQAAEDLYERRQGDCQTRGEHNLWGSEP